MTLRLTSGGPGESLARSGIPLDRRKSRSSSNSRCAARAADLAEVRQLLDWQPAPKFVLVGESANVPVV